MIRRALSLLAYTAAWTLVLAACVVVVTSPWLCLAGCVAPGVFSPAGAAGVDTAFAVLCTIVTPGACPAEEAAFDAVVASRTATSTPAPVPTSAPESTAISSRGTCPSASAAGPASGAPLVPLLRRGGPGEPPLVHVGSVPPGPTARALQVAALALPPGPVARKPPPSPSITVGRAPLPPAPAVLPVADGGKDGAP